MGSRKAELAYCVVKAVRAYDQLVRVAGSEAAANAAMANARVLLKDHKTACCEWAEHLASRQ